MKILFIGASADQYGADIVLLRVIEHLNGRGDAVRLLLPSDGPGRAAAAESGIETQVVPLPVLRRTELGFAGLVRLAARAARSVAVAISELGRRRPDLVYVNTLTNPIWLIFARVFRVAPVCHVHEIVPAKSLAARMLYLPLHLCTRVIAVSGACEKEIVATYPRLQDKVTVLLNPSFDVRRSLTNVNGPHDLVVLGRISPRKGQLLLLRALARMDLPTDLHVHFCGDVFPSPENERYLLEVKERAAQLSCKVTFHGFINKTEAYQLGDIVIVPSTEPDPCPLVVVEAMTAGKVVLAASTGGIPEQLNGAGAEFTPESDLSLAMMLTEILADSTARGRLKTLALARAQELQPAAYMSEVERTLDAAGATAGR